MNKIKNFELLEIIHNGKSSKVYRGVNDITDESVIVKTLTGRINRGIDYRTNFYSLGVTFFKLLTGLIPFATIQDPLEIIYSHIAQIPPTPREIRDDIPVVPSKIVTRLLAKNAKDRYQSSRGLAFDLEECIRLIKAEGSLPDFLIATMDQLDRFITPQKLYGREKEISRPLKAFEEVAGGNKYLMCVTGFSGIGKSALVREIHKPLSENVVVLMSQTIQELSENGIQVIKLALLIGAEFTPGNLSLLHEKSRKETASELYEALEAGLLTPLDDNYKFAEWDPQKNSPVTTTLYKFTHDRVQQAAYSLIKTENRLAFHYHIERAEAEYLVGNFETAENLFEISFQNARRISEKVSLLNLRSTLRFAQNLYQGSIDDSLEALSLPGFHFKHRVNTFSILKSLLKLKFFMRGKKPSDLDSKSELTDQRIQIARQTLLSSMAALYVINPKLLAFFTLESVILTVRYGISPEGSPGVIAAGLLFCSFNNFKNGYLYGKTGWENTSRRTSGTKKFGIILANCITYS